MTLGSTRIFHRLVRPLGLPLALSLVLASVSSPSFADAYDAAMASAVAAKEKAVDQNDPSAWQEAVRLFAVADALRSTKDSKYELAFAAARLKEDDLAVESYEASIALGLTGKAKDKAAAFIKQHLPKMARLEPTGPSGATIAINGRVRATLPTARPIVVFAGAVHLVITDDKGRSITDDVTIEAGKTQPIDFTDKLAVKSEPVPPTVTPPPIVKPEKDREVPIDDDGASARRLGWTLIVVGGSVAVIGGVTTFIAGSSLSNRRDSLADNCLVLSGTDSCPTARPDRQAEAQSDVDGIATWKGVRTAGIVALGTGGTLAAVGLVRLLTAPKAPLTASSTFTPQVAVTGGGVSFGLTGAF